MPASKRDAVGMRRHFAPRNDAAESFVSSSPCSAAPSRPCVSFRLRVCPRRYESSIAHVEDRELKRLECVAHGCSRLRTDDLNGRIRRVLR